MKLKQAHSKAGSEWVTTALAAAELGICTKTLIRRRDEGSLKLGKHYRIISGPTAIKPRYRWHVGQCAEFFGIPMEKRE
jgi:hypothetical protein